jgi:hypothetical protein
MIISSQSHRDYSIVDQKIQELQGKESVQIPVHYAGEMDGEKYFIQIDGHHTLEAARELGLRVEFVETDHNNWDNSWSLDEALEANWNDCDWYNVETGKVAF